MTAPQKTLFKIYVPLIVFLTLLLTNGRLGTFFSHDAFGTQIYANMWTHLLAGDFWVDYRYCTTECFLVSPSIWTSYFGFLPTFLRGAVSLLVDPYLLNLAKLSMLMSASVAYYFVARAFERLGLLTGPSRRLGYLYLLAIFVASPILYVFAWDWIYHEPIAWGLVAGLVFSATYLLWIFDEKERNPRNGLILGVAVGAAVMSRPSTGVMLVIPYAYLLVVTLFEYQRTRSVKVAKSVAAGLIVCCLIGFFIMTMNFARWGNPLTFMKMTSNASVLGNPFSTDLLNKYGEFNVTRLGASMAYNFVPTPDNFSTHWPFIIADRRLSWLPDFRTFGYVEATRVPLALNSVIFLVFSCLALRRWRRNSKEEGRYVTAFMIGGLVMTVMLSCFFGLALRYSIELVLPFIFLGMVFLVGQRRSGHAYPLNGWHYALFAFSLFVVLTTTISYKSYLWETPADVRSLINRTMLPPGSENYKPFLVGGQ